MLPLLIGLCVGCFVDLILGWLQWGRRLRNATALLRTLMGPSESLEEVKAKYRRDFKGEE